MNNYLDIDLQGLLELTADDIVGQSVAILGIKGSGKSNTAAVLMEELLARQAPICVVDVAGEYHTLKNQYPGVTVVGHSLTNRPDIEISGSNVAQLAEAAYTNGVSVVLDFSNILTIEREELLRQYFQVVWELSAIHRIPLITFLEEAHNWIPQVGQTQTKDLFTNIAKEGRKRGLSLVIIDQRSAAISKNVLSQADLAFLHRVRHPVDVRVYTDLIPRPKAWVREKVIALKTGECLTLLGEKVLHCKVRQQHTEHVGSTPTLARVPRGQLSLLQLLG